jgi:hypothetical protein
MSKYMDSKFIEIGLNRIVFLILLLCVLQDLQRAWCMFVLSGFSSELHSADGRQASCADSGYNPHTVTGVD